MAIQKIEVDLQRIVDKTKRKLETVILEFGQDFAEEAVRATPVDTGFLRGSWFTSINSVTSKPGTVDKGGAQTVAEMATGLLAADPGDTIYFLNGANYARFVEYGTVRMAPRAFLRSTVARAPMIAEETIRRIAAT